MNSETKEKIKKSMLEHLNSVGYPNISNVDIINQLPHLWNKLSRENLLDELVAKGFTYEMFTNIAIAKYNEFQVMEEVASFFRGKNNP